MAKPTTNAISEINNTRILKIKWPDETCTFVNEGYQALNGNLTIKYNFKDTNGRAKKPYVNSYNLDSFDTKIGTVKNVIFVSNRPSA